MPAIAEVEDGRLAPLGLFVSGAAGPPGRSMAVLFALYGKGSAT
eukprot:gene36748-3320_t